MPFGKGRGRMRHHQNIRLVQDSRHLIARHLAGESDAIRQPELGTEYLEALQIAFRRMTADDETADVRQPRQGTQKDVHTFPRIQVPDIRDHGLRGPSSRRVRPADGSRSIRHRRERPAWTESPFQIARQPVGDRDVAFGEPPHPRLTGQKALELGR